MYHSELFHQLRIFFKSFLVEIKAKYFFIGAKMRGVETEWRKAWWLTEAGRPVLRGLVVILQILRFGAHFCGDHGASAPPPSPGRTLERLNFLYHWIYLETLHLTSAYIYKLKPRSTLINPKQPKNHKKRR